jgi:predicted amidohydrolase
MEVDSSEFMRIRNAARDGEITVSLGFVERKAGSLYMAQTLIGPDGVILSHRHKTKPTHIERTLFGEGTGTYLPVSFIPSK